MDHSSWTTVHGPSWDGGLYAYYPMLGWVILLPGSLAYSAGFPIVCGWKPHSVVEGGNDEGHLQPCC